MKLLEILLFDEEINLLKKVRSGELDYLDDYDQIIQFLDTLSKCVADEKYYELYRNINKEIIEKHAPTDASLKPDKIRSDTC